MRSQSSKIRLACMLLGLTGVAVGYTSEALAIDRKPFNGRSLGDAGPGYGSEGSGYGAERQYYGAEGLCPHGRDRGDDHGYDDYGRDDDFYGLDDPGSSIVYGDSGAIVEGDGGYWGSGEDGNASGSFVYYGDRNGGDVGRSAGPKIIDVAEQSLDNRRHGRSGIEILYTGGAKIISISPGYGRTEGTKRDERASLEPWSEGWSRYCARTHGDFDPDRGTYVAGDGKVRFCTGE